MRMSKEDLISSAYRTAKYLPEESSDLMKELATRLDVNSVALSEALQQVHQLTAEKAVLYGEVLNWARECDRIAERFTKRPTNSHLVEAKADLRELCGEEPK